MFANKYIELAEVCAPAVIKDGLSSVACKEFVITGIPEDPGRFKVKFLDTGLQTSVLVHWRKHFGSGGLPYMKVTIDIIVLNEAQILTIQNRVSEIFDGGSQHEYTLNADKRNEIMHKKFKKGLY